MNCAEITEGAETVWKCIFGRLWRWFCDVTGANKEWLFVRLPLVVGSVCMLTVFYWVLPREQPVPASSTYTALVGAVRGSNAGHFYQFSPGVSVNRWFPSMDTGLFYLASNWILLDRLVRGPGAHVYSYRLAFHIMWAILAVALLAVSLPGIPLRFFVGALILFHLGMIFDIFGWRYHPYWAPPLAIIVVAVFLCSVQQRAHNTRLCEHAAVAVVLGALSGLLGLLRRDAGLIAFTAVSVYSGFLVLHWLVARLHLPSRPEFTAIRRRWPVLAHCAFFLAAFYIPQLIVHAHLRVHQWTSSVQHFDDSRPPAAHGMWHPLYVGLGLAPSDFGIEYKDEVAFAQAGEIDPGATYDTALYEPVIRRLFFSAIAEKPAILYQSLYKKWTMLVDLFGAWLWLAFLAALIVSFRFSTTESGQYLPIVLLSCVLPAAAVPLLVYPDTQYARGLKLCLYAGIVLTALAVPPATEKTEAGNLAACESFRRALCVVAVMLALLPMGLCWLQANANAAEARYCEQLNAADTAGLLRIWADNPRRFAVHFNQLPAARRQQLVEAFAGLLSTVSGGGTLQAQASKEATPFSIRNVTFVANRLFVFGKIERAVEAPGPVAVYFFPREGETSVLPPDRRKDGFAVSRASFPAQPTGEYALLWTYLPLECQPEWGRVLMDMNVPGNVIKLADVFDCKHLTRAWLAGKADSMQQAGQ
ncbi:MAG: hypothetical protein ABSE73_12120 [Planctomycetota bacterium]